MKKRSLSIALLMVVLVCSLLPTTAFAWDDTDMSAVLQYTKSAPTSEGTYTPKYEIAIPAPTQLNTKGSLEIRLIYNALSDSELLNVSVNPSSFAEDGYIHLTSSSTPDILKASLQRFGPFEPVGEEIDPVEGPFTVAIFDNSGLTPIRYGTVVVDLANDNLVSPGDYMGYIQFAIEVVPKD